jgi:hypothetical protein
MIAQVTGGTTTIPTVNVGLANRIKKGDRLIFDDNTGAAMSAPRDSGNPRRVVGVNYSTGAVTLSAAVSGLTTGDRIYFQDHYGTTRVPLGSFIWIPQTASDPFLGATRSGVPWLEGYRKNASGLDTSVALIQAASEMALQDRKPTHAIVSFKTWELLTADKDASKVVEIKTGKYEIGFPGITVHGAAGGTFVVQPSMFMGPGQCLLGKFSGEGAGEDKPYFVYGGDSLINLDDTGAGADGLRQRDASSDYELRCFSYMQLCFPNPGEFMQVYNLATA